MTLTDGIDEFYKYYQEINKDKIKIRIDRIHILYKKGVS